MKMTPDFYFLTKKNRGAVLIHVLLFSVLIFSISLAYFSKVSLKSELALKLQSRSNMIFLVESAKAQIEVILLSGDLSQAPAGFNFYGYPFRIGDIDVTIQDLSGLYPIFPRGNLHLLPLFKMYGYPDGQAREIVSEINDWQTPAVGRAYGRAYPIQHLSELKSVPGVGNNLYQKLLPFITLYPRPFFNPSLLPDALLELRYGKRIASVLTGLRRSGRFSTDEFLRITSENMDEYTSFSYGPAFRVRISLNQSGIVYGEHFEAVYKMSDKIPVLYWSHWPFDSERPQ